MGTYIIKRVLLMIPTFLLISLLVFILINVAPGRAGQQNLASSEGESVRDTAGAREGYQLFKLNYGLNLPLLFNTRYDLDHEEIEEAVEVVAQNLTATVFGEGEALHVGRMTTIVGGQLRYPSYFDVAQQLEDPDLTDDQRAALEEVWREQEFQEIVIRPARPDPAVLVQVQEDLEDYGLYAVMALYEITQNHENPKVRWQANEYLTLNAQDRAIDPLAGSVRARHPEANCKLASITLTEFLGSHWAYAQLGSGMPLALPIFVPTAIHRRLIVDSIPRYDVRNWSYPLNAPAEQIAEVDALWEGWFARNSYRMEYDFWEKVGIFFGHTRLSRYWGGLFSGDLGFSSRYERPVTDVIFDHWQYSILLSLLSVFFIYLFSVPIGLYSAVKQGGLFDRGVGLMLFLMYSLPSFFVATMLSTYLSKANAGGVMDIVRVVTVAILAGLAPAFLFVLFRDRTHEKLRLKRAWPKLLEPRFVFWFVAFMTASLIGGLYISGSTQTSMVPTIILSVLIIFVLPFLFKSVAFSELAADPLRRHDQPPEAGRIFTRSFGGGLLLSLFIVTLLGADTPEEFGSIARWGVAFGLTICVPSIVGTLTHRLVGYAFFAAGIAATVYFWKTPLPLEYLSGAFAGLAGLTVFSAGAIWRGRQRAFKGWAPWAWLLGALGTAGLLFGLIWFPAYGADIVTSAAAGIAILFVPGLAATLAKRENPTAAGVVAFVGFSWVGTFVAMLLFAYGTVVIFVGLVVAWPFTSAIRAWGRRWKEAARIGAVESVPFPFGRLFGLILAGIGITLLLHHFKEFLPAPVSGFETANDPEREIGALFWTTMEYLGDVVRHLVFPVFCLTYTTLALLSRYARTGLLDVIRSDYVRTARAKGLSEPVVIVKHAVRNGLIPILTLLGTTLPILIGGSVIIEQIFAIPGMGQLLWDSINNKDFNVILGILQISAVLTLIGILISDISYALVDPRITFD